MNPTDQEYLEILSMYLPYGVKGNYLLSDVVPDAGYELRGKELRIDNFDFFLKYATPILKPLSDYSDINSPAMKELDLDTYEMLEVEAIANKKYRFEYAAFRSIKAMAAAHIDFAGLIEKGMAINLNELTNK